MKLRRRVERNGDACTCACLPDADDTERLRRFQHGVTDNDCPGEPFRADAGKLGLIELELNDLSVTRARDRGIADAAAGLRGDLVDVDRRLAVEHQPDGVGTTKHRSW